MVQRKPVRKLFKIGEVMRYSGLSRQTLHNYTMLGLIQPVERTEAGHRLYPESVFDRLRRIELLKRHRTLAEVRRVLMAEDAQTEMNQQRKEQAARAARKAAGRDPEERHTEEES